MEKIVFFVLLLPFVFGCAKSNVTESDAIVAIKTDLSMGTGFVVSSNKNFSVILTANHVVDGHNFVQILFNTSEECIGLVAGRDSTRDLALIIVANAPKKKPLKFKKKEIRWLSRVHTIGHPVGLYYTYSKGYVQNSYRVYNCVKHYQLDILARGGSSGSPVFTKGVFGKRVIGLIVSYQSDMPDVAFAVQSSEIIDFLKNN